MMALERVPADIRKEGGVARMSDPKVGILAYCITLVQYCVTPVVSFSWSRK